LQRLTAWIALAFILYHVFHMHGWFHNPWYLEKFAEPLGGHQFDPHRATSTAAVAVSSLFMQAVYAVGVIATVYHLANGIWTMGITWGVWTSVAAQRRANWICLAFGIALTAVGLSALVGVATTDVDKAKAYEQAHIEAQEAEMRRAEELLIPKKP
jgi:succinate dehydrogenase / fumarate reductase cytochrome b subunit